MPRNTMFISVKYGGNHLATGATYAGYEMDRIALGNLELDRGRFEARIDGGRVDLTSTQFELLYQLASVAGRVVDRDQLLEAIWGSATKEEARKLRIHVSRLRKKIAASKPWRIETVKKRGYALVNSEAGVRLPAFVLAHAPGRTRTGAEFLGAGS